MHFGTTDSSALETRIWPFFPCLKRGQVAMICSSRAGGRDLGVMRMRFAVGGDSSIHSSIHSLHGGRVPGKLSAGMYGACCCLCVCNLDVCGLHSAVSVLVE